MQNEKKPITREVIERRIGRCADLLSDISADMAYKRSGFDIEDVFMAVEEMRDLVERIDSLARKYEDMGY